MRPLLNRAWTAWGHLNNAQQLLFAISALISMTLGFFGVQVRGVEVVHATSLVLLATGVAGVVFMAFVFGAAHLGLLDAPPVRVPPPPPSVALNLPEWPKQPPSRRKFVDAHVTPDYLLDLHDKGGTDARGTKLVEPFVGEWMRISGRVDGVSADGQVSLSETQLPRRLGTRLFLWFDPKRYKDDLARLDAGTPIHAEGRIQAVTGLWVNLSDCELIDEPTEGVVRVNWLDKARPHPPQPDAR